MPMQHEDIDATLLPRLRWAVPIDLENPFLLWLAGAASPLLPGTRVEGIRRTTARVGDVRLRVYHPPHPNGSGLLWIHGGGLVLGAATMDDRFCAETARETGAVVVSVDYRLAQRHPFSAAIDDCRAAWRAFVIRAPQLGVDPSRMAIGGQSAGGGLAASLVQRLHDEGADVAAQWLFCPMLDDRTAADRSRDEQAHFVWNNRLNLVGWSTYLRRQPGEASLPPYAAAARREDLSGLPATWIYWSDIELFAQEDADYARRLAEAGVLVETVVVPRAPHGFEAWASDTPLAKDLFRRARAWLTDALA